MDIGSDLRPQGINGWKFDFAAQATQKVNLNFSLGSQLQGMKIQEMGFNSE